MRFWKVVPNGAVLLLAGLAACGQNTATTEAKTDKAAETQASSTTTVATLPLTRGYYVRADTPCNQASRADVFLLLTRTGTNLNCTFKTIEKTGATTYRVMEDCADGGAAWGQEDRTQTSTTTYEIPNETSYTATYEGGYEVSGRYCAQSSMSPEYRDNDIGDAIR